MSPYERLQMNRIWLEEAHGRLSLVEAALVSARKAAASRNEPMTSEMVLQEIRHRAASSATA